ncbi:hypothetical protein [Streptomyces acidiscabies]|uniref:Uncharacterized protein n=1 Tax=Streptomyces acidiscabies TaxID=42234 RepID=A0A0L0JD48_9ACTN|nr:hypothetical protein [Streptomyces acidiscabies]KND23280.1 hypothetical protein IQ63_45230 [Streptomyces acidiscabies]
MLIEPYGTELRLFLNDNAYRLQLQIASSDFPHFVAHPGTDESPWTATPKVAVEQRLFLGGDRTATPTLPVITFD